MLKRFALRWPLLALLAAVVLAPHSSAQAPSGKERVGAKQAAGKTFGLAVTDEAGKPISGAQAQFRFSRGPREPLTTDANGNVSYPYPEAESGSLTVQVFADGYVPYGIMFDSQVRQYLPTKKSIQLKRGVPVGGTILDPDGKPVADARVTMTLPYTESAKSNYVFTVLDAVTGKDGKWKLSAIAEPTKARYLRVQHDSFPESTFAVENSPTAMYKLIAGMTVTGTVVGPDGKPIVDAVIHRGDTIWGTSNQVGRTDELGHYTLNKMTLRDARLTIYAAGFAPQMKTAKLDAKKNTIVDFTLAAGRELTIQVVDEDDKPLPGVRVVADTWREVRTLPWRGRTNAKGIVVWPSAPEDEVEFDVLLRDHRAARNVRLKAADKVHKIVLHKETIRRGIVKDAKTGAMIPEFEVCFGTKEGEYLHWFDSRATQGRGGKFVAIQDEPWPKIYLRVTADGYKTWLSKEIKLDVPYGIFDVRMEPDSGTRILVLDPDNKPATKVTVCVGDPEELLAFQPGYKVPDAKMTFVTDDSGAFTLPSLKDPSARGYVVAINDNGYAEIPMTQLVADEKIQLTAWAKLTATVMRGNKPVVGTRVRVWPTRLDKPYAVDGFSLVKKTDANGRVVFDRVVPRGGRVTALVTESLEKADSEYLGREKRMEFQPGGEYSVTFGGSGRSIEGRIALPPDPPAAHEWRLNQAGSLESNGLTWGHPDYREYRFFVEPDGSFRIDDVEPGDYRLRLSLTDTNTERIGDGETIGSVKKMNIDHSLGDDVHDLGTLHAVWEYGKEELKRRKMAIIAAAHKNKSAALYGRVMDTRGQPVTDATIALTGTPYLIAETDSQGRYAVVDLVEPRECKVYVRSKSCVGVGTSKTAETIKVDPAKPVIRNFTLERACQIKVTAVDQKGRPPAKFAIVQYTPLNDDSAKDYPRGRQVVTDNHGVAIIGGLPAGKKWLIAVKSYGPLSALSHAVVSAEKPGEAYEKRITFRPGTSVKGTVVYSDGTPAAGCSITPLQTWHAFQTHVGGPTIKEDGSFVLNQIGDDQYDVSVRVGGDKPRSIEVLTNVSLAKMKQPIQIKLDVPKPPPAKSNKLAPLRMEDGKIVMSLSGRILPPERLAWTGEPPADTTVKAWLVAADNVLSGTRPTIQPLDVKMTYHGFRFQIADDPLSAASMVHITATSGDEKWMAATSIAACEFAGATKRVIELKMQPSRRVKVTVTSDGKPVVNANVKMDIEGHTTSPDYSARTNAAGTCELKFPQDALLRGIVAWTDDQIGGIDFRGDRSSNPDADQQTIELVKCQPRRIRILDQNDQPVANAAIRVLVTTASGNPMMRFGKEYLVTDAKGEATDQWYPDLEAEPQAIIDGDWVTSRVSPIDQDRVSVAKVTTFDDKQPKRITGKLDLPDHVEGGLRVVFAREVQLKGYVSSKRLYARCDLEGNFAADVLPGEKYFVCVDDEEWASKPWIGTLVDADTGKAETPILTVVPGSPLTFQITSGPTRQPLANAIVTITNVLDVDPKCLFAHRSWFVRTDSKGLAKTQAMPGTIYSTTRSQYWDRLEARPDFGNWKTDVVQIHRDVHRQRTVHGRLNAASDSNISLAGARVQLFAMDPYRHNVEATLTKHGRFTGDIAAADVVVLATTVDGSASAYGVLRYPSDTIELTARPTKTLDGQLLDTANQPLANKRILLTGLVPDTQLELLTREVVTDADGKFTVANLPTLIPLSASVFEGSDTRRQDPILADKQLEALKAEDEPSPVKIRVPRIVE